MQLFEELCGSRSRFDEADPRLGQRVVSPLAVCPGRRRLRHVLPSGPRVDRARRTYGGSIDAVPCAAMTFAARARTPVSTHLSSARPS